MDDVENLAHARDRQTLDYETSDHGTPDAEALDHEAPDASDLRDNDDDELVGCPECGKRIYETSERCPYCGEWITHAASRRGWALIAVLLVIAATLATWMW